MPIIKKSAVNLQLIGNRAFVRFARKLWNRCQWCNKFFSRHVPATCDHIVPKRHGGDDNWYNLCLSCLPCNSKHADQLIGRPPFGPPDWELVRSGKPGTPPPLPESKVKPRGIYVFWFRRADGIWRQSARGNYRQCVAASRDYLSHKRKRYDPPRSEEDTRILPEGESP